VTEFPGRVQIKDQIDAQLASLIGLPLSDASRAADMATFGFGSLIERQGRRGPVQIPQYRLHIQETWRVTKAGAVLLGYGDYHYPPRGSAVTYHDFVEADEPRNRQDDLRDDWVSHGAAAHTVVEASGSEAGDLAISFADGCQLATFANQASLGGNGDDEFWRLLQPHAADDEPDFVVTARGVES
jgi:hypothetical protein